MWGKYAVSLYRQNFEEGTLFIFTNHTHEMETKSRNKALNAYENSSTIFEHHFNCCDHGGNSLLDPGQETGNGAFQTIHLTSILSPSTETEKQQATFRITKNKLRSVAFT
jgi:hypothetical protein